MNGVIPTLDPQLRGTQTVDIDFAIARITDKVDYKDYLLMLAVKRGELVDDFLNILFTRTGPVEDPTAFSVDEVLEERGAIYGSYGGGVKCRATMLGALEEKYQETHDGETMPEDLRIIFGDLVLKMMRAASDPTHDDSWLDLEGYARIIHGFVKGCDVFDSK